MIPPIFLHFALMFTEQKQLLKKWITYFVIYGPSILIILIWSTTNLVIGPPVKIPNGWAFTFTNPFIYFISIIWTFLLALIGVAIFVYTYFAATEVVKKQQAKYITIGMMVPIFIGIIVAIIGPALRLRTSLFPINIFFLVTILFTSYAISEYQLFVINPATAAKNIVSTMADALIIINTQGKILSVNKAARKLLKYKKGEIAYQPASLLFKDLNFWQFFSSKRFKVRNYETVLLTSDKKEIPVLFSSSLVRDKKGNLSGIIGIAKDITDRKTAEEAIKLAETRKAYVDVFSAATGEKLILLTKEELEKSSGKAITKSYTISDYKDLSNARAMVRKGLEKYFPSIENKEDILVATDEALTNAIKHAGSGKYQVLKPDETAQILISDNGPGIDFKSLPKATLLSGYSTKQTLGVGFNILLELSDRILLSTEPGGTSIVVEVSSHK